jgi:LPS-assembly lipoprotein
LSLATLSACGFKPIYAQDSVSRQEFQQIYISEIPNREGQVLRNKLQDLLGGSGNKYRLDIALTKERREFGIQQDFRISRYDIVLTADYSLFDNEKGEVVLKDAAKIYSAFNRTESEFSTFVAEEDAIEEAAGQLAYRINLKLAAFFE